MYADLKLVASIDAISSSLLYHGAASDAGGGRSAGGAVTGSDM